MHIDLTPEQFRSLVKIVYLGDWMANAQRVEPIEEYDSIENHIYSYAAKFGASDLIEHAVQLKGFLPTREMEDSLMSLIDEYDVNTMFENVEEELAKRDVRLDNGEEKMHQMDPGDLWGACQPYIDKYNLEFRDHGLDRLFIQAPKQETIH